MPDMTEVPPIRVKALRKADADRAAAEARYGRLIAEMAELYGISAVARALGISRQAVQARLKWIAKRSAASG
jgi:DNA invertase Pin-like site-specific DNA recombinase